MASELELKYRGYRTEYVRDNGDSLSGCIRLKNGDRLFFDGADCEEFQQHFRWSVDSIYDARLEERDDQDPSQA